MYKFYPILLFILLASCGVKTEKTVDNNATSNDVAIKTAVTSITDESLYLKCKETEDGNSCGYFSADGKEVIKQGKYFFCLTDTFTTMARVSHPEKGFVGINRKEEVLFTIFNFDNFADQPVDGIFRIVDGDNMGLANLEGNIIAPAKYSGLYSIENGYAAFCDGCKKEYMGEHFSWEGGKWGALDKTGKEVISAKYDIEFMFDANGKAKVQLDGKTITIDTQGNEVK